MRTREEEREERRRYEADVEYEVWRSGGNMDAVNRDRVDDNFYDGRSVESSVKIEIKRQKPNVNEQEFEHCNPIAWCSGMEEDNET